MRTVNSFLLLQHHIPDEELCARAKSEEMSRWERAIETAPVTGLSL